MDSEERIPGSGETYPPRRDPPAEESLPDEQGREVDEAYRKKPAARKRTKTGCITCRKRRIKCDEAHPTCRNCLKSKRHCEGYSQRVVFKDPIGHFHGVPYGPLYSPDGPVQGLPNHHHHHMGPGIPGPSPDRSAPSVLQPIAPRPPPVDFHGQHPYPYAVGFHPQSLPPSPDSVYPFPQAVHHPDTAPTAPPFDAGIPGRFPFVPPPPPPPPPPPRPRPQQQQQHVFPLRPFHDSQDLFSGVRGPVGPSGQLYPGQPDGVVASARIQDQLRRVGPEAHSTGVVMYESDEEMSTDESEEETSLSPSQNVLNRLLSSHRNGPLYGHDARLRSYSTFAHDGILATYAPIAGNTPLTDPTTAAVFAHFLSVTGPSMSLYERHPFDASKLFEEETFQQKSQSIWTYTFPIIAFSHPSLMHAILALGALQIATLQRAPPMAAIKQYHLAIRRLAHNVRSPRKRTLPATLAATLLLAYFEVWSSDHSKWCNHLYGARILFSEIDLSGMTGAILPLKRARQHQIEKDFAEPLGPFDFGFATADRTDYGRLDVDLLNRLAGVSLPPEAYGQGENPVLLLDGDVALGVDREIEEYEHLRDLFWWYAKMDIYQSILGGTKPFMEYVHWTQCPPRGPIGKADAIYGTYDHLMLLLGRLVDFAARDLSRKTKVFRQNRPPGNSPPMFPGMLPTQGKVSAPMGFPPPRDSSPYSEPGDEGDVEAATEAARLEWDGIKEAFEVLRKRFGSAFEPLGPEYADRRSSPFGSTLQYRTFSMAGIWMNYYMGLIYLERCHPTMPPVAMMAAGKAAPQTGFYANEIGRIAAGLAEDCGNVTEISTLVGAALTESCFCLFVAAVQYRDKEQRRWMVRRMNDIARLTGWQSARQIADGCESGWIKAHQMGRGPPYERFNQMHDEPSSIWANPRRIDRVMRNTSDNRLALVRSERAHYALGLLSVEHDFENLELKEEPL